MSEKWRLLDMGPSDACTNMAVDEAIIWSRAEKLVPNTVRLYTWAPSAVSIGFFQSITQEVNLEACEKAGVDVIRRITGGGAVYHDHQGELTYSIVLPEDHPKIPSDLIEAYKVLCGGLILGLRHLGVDAEFTPINDITVRGKKISGNAQTRKRGVILQHGTLLLKTDISTIFQLLRVSKEKISDKAVKVFHDRVTTLVREVGEEVPLVRVREVIKRGFEEIFDIQLLPGQLTAREIELSKKIREKYTSKAWNFAR